MRTHPAGPAGPTITPDDLAALQAVAEPNRARIVTLLSHGEHCVCDVGDALGLSTALVSHHLRVLRNSGLLRERPAGRWTFYSLDVERLAGLRGAITALLTPTDVAATAWLCSDCGTKASAAVGDPGRDLPRLGEVMA
jgi:ArsR family transcriptional regulator, arsenate/arsenite/antimonite-responsive transcriptional repressor